MEEGNTEGVGTGTQHAQGNCTWKEVEFSNSFATSFILKLGKLSEISCFWSLSES